MLLQTISAIANFQYPSHFVVGAKEISAQEINCNCGTYRCCYPQHKKLTVTAELTAVATLGTRN
jgi:hypothetical protein